MAGPGTVRRRITVDLAVEINPQDWAEEYGVNLDEVDDDLRSSILTGVQGHMATLFGEGRILVALRTTPPTRGRGRQSAH